MFNHVCVYIFYNRVSSFLSCTFYVAEISEQPTIKRKKNGKWQKTAIFPALTRLQIPPIKYQKNMALRPFKKKDQELVHLLKDTRCRQLTLIRRKPVFRISLPESMIKAQQTMQRNAARPKNMTIWMLRVPAKPCKDDSQWYTCINFYFQSVLQY